MEVPVYHFSAKRCSLKEGKAEKDWEEGGGRREVEREEMLMSMSMSSSPSPSSFVVEGVELGAVCHDPAMLSWFSASLFTGLAGSGGWSAGVGVGASVV